MSGESFDRYFRSIRENRQRRPSGRLWCRAADGWIVKVDLAGVHPEDVEISIDGPLLRVSGLRRDSFCGEGVSHYQLEITYSRFEKTIQFPRSIEHASLARDYRDGLLILRLHEEQEDTKAQARAASRT